MNNKNIKSVKIQIALPRELHKKLKKEAVERGMYLKNYILLILKNG